jgi:hypothetical protein
MSIFRYLKIALAVIIWSGLCMSQAHSDSGIRNAMDATHLAALQELDPDTGNTSVPCGADGKCNAGACNNDPDCPDFGTPPPSTDSSPAQSSTEVIDCASGERAEMRETVAWGAANWNAFESAMESFYGWPVNIKNCLENRFKDNGKIVCEDDMKGNCKGANAWASPFNKRCHLCPVFVDKVTGLTGSANKDNRKACYLAILAHEWAHTCERTHKSIEIIDNVAFDFYKDRHQPEVTIDLSDCGMN